jgi:hypothetical protein
MRRIKTVLGVVAVMAAMLVALAAPALADNSRHDNNDRNHNWFDNDRHHDDWFDHRYYDDDIIFVSDNDIDDFYYPYWGWGFYPYFDEDVVDCGYDWGGPVNPYDCFD